MSTCALLISEQELQISIPENTCRRHLNSMNYCFASFYFFFCQKWDIYSRCKCLWNPNINVENAPHSVSFEDGVIYQLSSEHWMCCRIWPHPLNEFEGVGLTLLPSRDSPPFIVILWLYNSFRYRVSCNIQMYFFHVDDVMSNIFMLCVRTYIYALMVWY